MPIERIDHVQLAMPVGAEERAREFYQGVLGIPEVPKPAPKAARGGCWFARGELKVHLGADANFRAAQKAHPAFVVVELRSLSDKLKARGYAVREDESIDGHVRIHVDDPFGNRIEFMEARVDECVGWLFPTRPCWRGASSICCRATAHHDLGGSHFRNPNRVSPMPLATALLCAPTVKQETDAIVTIL